MTRLYCLFHLNLNYSAVETKSRSTVIRNCYWPILRLAERNQIPLGIEMSGYTLEQIERLDPKWQATFKKLLSSGLCELIGSGYSQLIGPLVPAEVNEWNQTLGLATYQRLLNVRPKIALVNEMAYSAGMVGHYLQNGYEGIVMDWSNPRSFHPEWRKEWRYFPQRAVGLKKDSIPLIWSDSIAFQKFQRYAHGEYCLEEYMAYLESHRGRRERYFPLYTNDAEIFDFRPGRFETEAELGKDGEWGRVETLFKVLKKKKGMKFVLPSVALKGLENSQGGHLLRLESPEQPIPVKKQGKYNISRWAVTGRNDLAINTACRRIYDVLSGGSSTREDDWKELCYLWSSDFRTHITERRWKVFQARLNAFQKSLGVRPKIEKRFTLSKRLLPSIRRTFDGRTLTIETKKIRLSLDCKKGLAIQGLCFKSISKKPLLGTLPHGYFDDINMGADYFSGHLTFEMPGSSKITDLSAVNPQIQWDPKERTVLVRAKIKTSLGVIQKTVRVYAEEERIELGYRLLWKELPLGSLRLGAVTLNPEAFDRKTLYFKTHNGGEVSEKFEVCGRNIDHGHSENFLVSAQQGLGMTQGVIELGDHKTTLNVVAEKGQANLLGLIKFKAVGSRYFFRLNFSAREMDETARLLKVSPRDAWGPLQCQLAIMPAMNKKLSA